ncbi:MAG: hypothetical protein OXB92_13105 [Acidimicrobiaceae bacterium]|nr:hypothetical protein [Acidimicrobiaceae bacterium]
MTPTVGTTGPPTFNLIRHLRRLTHLSVENARVVNSLPASLD